jgi:hypothetical protein
MRILVAENPSDNGYIESLILAYQRAGHSVICGPGNFYFSNDVPDVLHIQWPESLYKWFKVPSIDELDYYSLIRERLIWYKDRGSTIVHTIHNLQPHDSKLTHDEDIYRLVMEYSDVLVHHCEKSVELVGERHPDSRNKINLVCAHGDYLNHYREVDKAAARLKYGISSEKFVVLNFGKQRPYKNDGFINAVFRGLGGGNAFLVIAGYFEIPSRRLLTRLYYRARNLVRTRFNHRNKLYLYRQFPVSEIPQILGMTDIVFIAQQHALNSGLLPLAATYGKPVVCPDTGCFRSAVEGWVYETYSPGDLEDARRAINAVRKRLVDNPEVLDNSRWLSENSWDRHVNKILDTIGKPA